MRIVVAKEEFEGLIQHPLLNDKPNLPYLILANKKDLPNAVPVQAITQMLELERSLQNRPWQIKTCAGLNTEEVREAFNWLVDYLANLPAGEKEAKPRS